MGGLCKSKSTPATLYLAPVDIVLTVPRPTTRPGPALLCLWVGAAWHSCAYRSHTVYCTCASCAWAVRPTLLKGTWPSVIYRESRRNGQREGWGGREGGTKGGRQRGLPCKGPGRWGPCSPGIAGAPSAPISCGVTMHLPSPPPFLNRTRSRGSAVGRRPLMTHTPSLYHHPMPSMGNRCAYTRVLGRTENRRRYNFIKC